MSVYYPGCSTAISDPQCTDCPTTENGDIRSVFFVKNDFAFTDISDASEWNTGLTARDIFVFPYTQGTIDGEAIMVPGFGDTEEEFDGFNFTANLTDPVYKNNYGFWNTFKSQKNWKFGYRTENYVHLADSTCIVVPKAPVSEGKTSAVRWTVEVKFSQDDWCEPFDKPSNVFDQCTDLL